MASIMEEEPGAVLTSGDFFFRGWRWRATPVYKFMYKIGNVVLLRL